METNKHANKISAFFAVLVACILIGGVYFFTNNIKLHENQEIDAMQYSAIASWADEFPELKKEVQARAKDGQITNKEREELLELYTVKKRKSLLENVFND